ncbi:MAG: SprT family zinc-dependent metalloprotease [Anaerolineaceae bacterium]|nr:SprT family zinc-dependent metalloprotease [Anaerolineaceae bacterium]
MSLHPLVVGDLVVEVVRKKVKHIRLTVYPPDGRVRVSIPLRVNDESVRQAVQSKLTWILRQQAKMKVQEQRTPREYISGEKHSFQGNRFVLNVSYRNASPSVRVRDNCLELSVHPGSDTAQRERVLVAWYRRQLKEAIPPLIAKWEARIGVSVSDWGVRQMKTKWGTCNIRAHRIWLNLELVKKPERCLEYVVVHEMVHLLERYHNAHFKGLMDQFLPQWRLLKDELKREPVL